MSSALESAALQAMQENIWYNTWAVQELFLAVNEATAMGWLGSVVATTLGLRALVGLPIHTFSMRNALALSKCKKDIDAIMGNAKAQLEMQQSGLDKKQITEVMMERVKGVYRKHKARPAVGALAALSTAVILGTPFRATYTLSFADPAIPSLASTEFLWVPSLAAADPLYALPVLSGLGMLTAIELSLSEQSKAMVSVNKTFSPENMRTPLRLMVPLMTYFVFWDMPALMHGLILANTAFQIGQSKLMVSSAFRAAVGLPSMDEVRALQREQAEAAEKASVAAVAGTLRSLSGAAEVAEVAARAAEERRRAEGEGGMALGSGEFVALGKDGKAVRLSSNPNRGAKFRERQAGKRGGSARK